MSETNDQNKRAREILEEMRSESEITLNIIGDLPKVFAAVAWQPSDAVGFARQVDFQNPISEYEAIGILEDNTKAIKEAMLEAGWMVLEERTREYLRLRDDLRPRTHFFVCLDGHIIAEHDAVKFAYCCPTCGKTVSIDTIPLYLYRVTGALSKLEIACLQGDTWVASFNAPTDTAQDFEVFTHFDSEDFSPEYPFDLNRNALDVENGFVLEPLGAETAEETGEKNV